MLPTLCLCSWNVFQFDKTKFYELKFWTLRWQTSAPLENLKSRLACKRLKGHFFFSKLNFKYFNCCQYSKLLNFIDRLFCTYVSLYLTSDKGPWQNSALFQVRTAWVFFSEKVNHNTASKNWSFKPYNDVGPKVLEEQTE